MKNLLLPSLFSLALAFPLLAQTPAADVTAAAKKLAERGAYQWTSKTDMGSGGGGGQFRPGPTEGWRTKDGLTLLKVTRNDTTTEIVVKGEKGAYKADGNWQAVDTTVQGGGGGGGGGQPNPGRAAAGALRRFKAPATEAEELVAKATELKKDGDAIAGALTPDSAKALATFGGGRGGGGAPEVSDAKGTVKFWIKDGVLSKYEYKVQGKMSFNGNERAIDRTTTVEIKDGGPAPDAIPDAAKKLVS
ncbi:MAG TPA: hypothetical protein PLX89_23705 [Verrucomicrobiota bacterium]|nr:hypothetical protein [Verrucomicrobiales bacterium]HRI16015.1 hypothetical protein [Verrucomicrobiota bacterium]